MSKETKESAAAASSSGVTSNDGAALAAELVKVKLKKKAHVAGCIAAPGAVLNVTKESADRLVADGVAVILY